MSLSPKKQPLTVEQFDEFFRLLSGRNENERSWRVSIEEIQAKNYDVKAVNPNKKIAEDTRTPEELISLIDSLGGEIAKALAALKNRGV